MKKILLLVVLVGISGCFEDAEIKFKPDRIDVSVNSDSRGMLAIWASAWLDIERNITDNPNLGLGRPVYFDSNGLVPSACTEAMNCQTRYGEPLHALARDHLEIRIGVQCYADFDSSYQPLVDRALSEQRWIESDFRRLGFETVEVVLDRYCAPSIPRPEEINQRDASYLAFMVLNNDGAEPVSFNDPNRFNYSITDGPYFAPHPLETENPGLCDNRVAAERYRQEREEAFTPKTVGRFKSDELNRIVQFHIYNHRSSCPTVDPINWAFDGDCY